MSKRRKTMFYEGFAQIVGYEHREVPVLRMLNRIPIISDEVRMPGRRMNVLYGTRTLGYVGGFIIRALYAARIEDIKPVMLLIDVNLSEKKPLKERRGLVLSRMNKKETSELRKMLPISLEPESVGLTDPSTIEAMFDNLPNLDVVVWSVVWRDQKIQIATLRNADVIEDVHVYDLEGDHIVYLDKNTVYEHIHEEHLIDSASSDSLVSLG